MPQKEFSSPPERSWSPSNCLTPIRRRAVLLKYIEQFEKRFQMPVSGFGGYAYDAMHLLAKALPGSDGDKQKIRDALEKLKGHVGVTGTFNFSPQDHNGLGSDAFVMVQIQKGTWKLLSP